MKNGIFSAVGSCILWGLLPLYMHLVSHIPVFEILAHRIIWALFTVLLLLYFSKDLKIFLSSFKKPKLFLQSALTAIVITCNWGTYIWAISNNHTLDAALGYYISPLLSIMIGAFILREDLSAQQWFAFFLAATAVVILAISSGKFPWIALIIAFSFSLYGFLKKHLSVNSVCGFAIEATILFIPAFAIACYYSYIGSNHFTWGCWRDNILLIGMGPFTAIPLILYAQGVKTLSLSVIGILQYLTPTLVFFVAIFVLKEDFFWTQFWCFVMIWISIAIYIIYSFRQQKTKKLKKI